LDAFQLSSPILFSVGLLKPNKNDHPAPVFSPVVRPFIGLAHLIYTAALQAFYYGQRTRVRNEFSSLVVGWLVSRCGNRIQDLWMILLGFNNPTPNQLS